MAGSLSYQTYQSDAGQSFAIYCDLSNALAVNASASATPTGLPTFTLPRSIRPRYALFRSADGKTTRKVPLLLPSDVAALVSTKSFVTNPGGVTVTITSIVGEKARIAKNIDTGLTT